MAVNVLNAFVGTPPIDGGVFFRAPVGTPLPTDALSALDSRFNDHGACGEDGITVAQTRDNTDIKMFGGKTFVNVQTNYDETITITLLEDDNEAVLKTSFGDANVIITEATTTSGTKKTIYHTADPLPISSFVIEAISGKKTKRYVIENGQVVSVAEIKDVHNNVTSRTLTIKTYAPTSVELQGGNVVEYRDDGTYAVSGGPTALAVTTTNLPAGKVGEVYSQTLTATGGTGSKTWTIDTGNLPAGLTLSSAGVVGGTPTAAGTPNVTFKVTDSASATATKSLTVTVTV